MPGCAHEAYFDKRGESHALSRPLPCTIAKGHVCQLKQKNYYKRIPKLFQDQELN